MKLTLKELVKLIAPYLVAIGMAIGVYADGTQICKSLKSRRPSPMSYPPNKIPDAPEHDVCLLQGE